MDGGSIFSRKSRSMRNYKLMYYSQSVNVRESNCSYDVFSVFIVVLSNHAFLLRT